MGSNRLDNDGGQIGPSPQVVERKQKMLESMVKHGKTLYKVKEICMFMRTYEYMYINIDIRTCMYEYFVCVYM